MSIEGLNKKVVMSDQEIIKDILEQLFPLNRNLVSDEFEESLRRLSKYIPLKIHRYKTGTACWTWNVPPKWRIKDGYIRQGGEEIVSFRQHPLHVMSYSIPVRGEIKGGELLKHIYVHPVLPDAIPYEFSFYKRCWGFCLTHAQKDLIQEDQTYEVCIDSEFVDDYLSVGEYAVPGTSDEYIYFLCHIDHPGQVNDGIIGAAVNVALAKRLEEEKPYYNYTFLFVPETIGSIVYLSHNENLIPKIRYAVFNEATGLDNSLILQESYGNKGFINKYALYAMEKLQGSSKAYPYLSVLANDEKVFNSPGVNVPSISITRVDQECRLLKEKVKQEKAEGNAPVWPYPGYHTHLDDLTAVNFQRAQEAMEYLYSVFLVIEKDFIPQRKFKGPVFLSKYDLWVDWRRDYALFQNLTHMMYCLEGDMTVFQIAEKLGLDFEQVFEILNKFYDKGLIEKKRIPIGFDR